MLSQAVKRVREWREASAIKRATGEYYDILARATALEPPEAREFKERHKDNPEIIRRCEFLDDIARSESERNISSPDLDTL